MLEFTENALFIAKNGFYESYDVNIKRVLSGFTQWSGEAKRQTAGVSSEIALLQTKITDDIKRYEDSKRRQEMDDKIMHMEISRQYAWHQAQTYKERLHSIIPGGAHTYSRGDDQFPSNAPAILDRGEGAFVYSPDGQKYLDYGMGLRSVNIGYGDLNSFQA
ncbi:MAG: hypothetical protein EB036_10340 [Betaproteobacteria bacterium]|nr:hypothetical protein [Betaproteobacteria bacterium]